MCKIKQNVKKIQKMQLNNKLVSIALQLIMQNHYNMIFILDLNMICNIQNIKIEHKSDYS